MSTIDVSWGRPTATVVVDLRKIRRQRAAAARAAARAPRAARETEFPPAEAFIAVPTLTDDQKAALEDIWAKLPPGELVCLQTERQIREDALLAPRNPNGWRLEDLLHQIHAELGEVHRVDVWANAIESEATDIRRRLLKLLHEAEILATALDDVSPGTKTRRRYGPGAPSACP